ncbi:MAG: DUF899 domain-containing protein [Trueperaceae bacterium]|nr:DUF899 domain-containing protein [Trueperaceae bacterium]
MSNQDQNLPSVVSREEWRAARVALLAKEKAATRARDALNIERRNLPMVLVDKEYRFAGPEGEVNLADMFDGKSQLIVQHFMFDPEWEKGCPGCTAGVDETGPGIIDHLRKRDTNFVLVSRAPLPKLEAYKKERNWTLPWYSSFGNDFNYDFDVTLDPRVKPVEYNYRPQNAPAPGAEVKSEEAPGFSCFLKLGDDVFHTYSTYARGTENTGSGYYFLDLTALGRQEQWEEPKGRAAAVRPNVPFFE